MSLVDKISAVVEAIGAELKLKADAASLATVATSGSYEDLDDKPSIPPALPSQSGQAGKVLGTDGTSPSWVSQSGGGGGGSTNPILVMADYTAGAGDVVLCTTELTVTFPLTAAHGDRIDVLASGDVVHTEYFNIVTQQVDTSDDLPTATLSIYYYIVDLDMGGGPMSGWMKFLTLDTA